MSSPPRGREGRPGFPGPGCAGIGHRRAVECPWSVGQGQKQRVKRERGGQEIKKAGVDHSLGDFSEMGKRNRCEVKSGENYFLKERSKNREPTEAEVEKLRGKVQPPEGQRACVPAWAPLGASVRKPDPP